MCVCSWPEKAMNWSWGVLTNLNSGQIQVVIALFALWLAKKGYDKLIEQIDMAKDQFKASEEQTKQYAKQVQEAAKQTEIAAKHFENSNVQIQELIDHRNVVLGIRNGELKSDCIDLSIKAIGSIQEAEDVLKRGVFIVNEINNLFDLKDKMEIKNWLDVNHSGMTNELNALRERLTVLIQLSGKIATNQDIRKNEDLEAELMTIKMIYLRAVRVKCIYQEFISEVGRKFPVR